MLFELEGRKPGKRTPDFITHRVLGSLGYGLEAWHTDSRTIVTLERELPDIGSFLVWVKGHLLAHVNGTTYDWAAGRRHRVQAVYQVVHQLGLNS